MIMTTINIQKTVKESIFDACILTGKNQHEILSRVLHKIIRSGRINIILNKAVAYQNREKRDWTKLHITLSNNDYECVTDLRKFLKRSVSLIFAEGVRKFLNTIIKEILENKDEDNYFPFFGYSIEKSIKRGILSFKTTWNTQKPTQPTKT